VRSSSLAPSIVSGSPPAIEAAGICRRYGRRWALVDVGFVAPRGATLVVAGRNGAGKSTLLRVLATAIRPDRGTARIEGFDIRDHKPEVRRRTSLLGHHSNLYEALTALENLQVTARFLGRDASRAALLERLAEVSLADRADDPVTAFSAGMRKRLMLCRTLLKEASLVLLDEPYGQLDPPGFRLVDDVIARLRSRGATVLLATHLLERGAALGDRGLVLEAGRVAWEGRAADLPTEGGLPAAGLPEGAGA
jgi:heme ABC exporter ATP-binding subunit CcmA